MMIFKVWPCRLKDISNAWWCQTGPRKIFPELTFGSFWKPLSWTRLAPSLTENIFRIPRVHSNNTYFGCLMKKLNVSILNSSWEILLLFPCQVSFRASNMIKKARKLVHFHNKVSPFSSTLEMYIKLPFFYSFLLKWNYQEFLEESENRKDWI